MIEAQGVVRMPMGQKNEINSWLTTVLCKVIPEVVDCPHSRINEGVPHQFILCLCMVYHRQRDRGVTAQVGYATATTIAAEFSHESVVCTVNDDTERDVAHHAPFRYW